MRNASTSSMPKALGFSRLLSGLPVGSKKVKWEVANSDVGTELYGAFSPNLAHTGSGSGIVGSLGSAILSLISLLFPAKSLLMSAGLAAPAPVVTPHNRRIT